LGVWTAWLLPQASATSSAVTTLPANRIKQLSDEALILEKQGRWADAWQKYNEILREDRAYPEIRQRLQQCARRWQQLRRHAEKAYRDQVLRLKYSEILNVYEGLLRDLQDHYVDRTNLDQLYKRGVNEFRFALENRVLLRYMGGRLEAREKEYLCRAFAAKLTGWEQKSILSRADAVKQVREIAMAAQRPLTSGGLDLNANLVVMEFACGACAALDEYTFYLTPGQLRKLTDAVNKPRSVVGVGIELYAKDSRLLIARVLPRSPAEDEGLRPDDEITRIDKRSTENLTPDAAMDLLKGAAGTAVEIGVVSIDGMERPVSLKRKRLVPRSVEFGWLVEKMEMSMENQKQTEIGYIQILHFHKNTPQELDAALLNLRQGGMRGLILDLRGNPGGSFEAAVDCARRFLSSGVIVTTKKHDAKPTKYIVKSGSLIAPVPEDIPIAVLVDGDTASAAEVLAGALKDNKRATLVGRTTFGKLCSQQLLVKELGGIRITVARFYSPNGLPYSRQGIAPHVPAERYVGGDRLEDHQLMEAKRLVAETMKSDPMPMRP
jgi:carboxyl-terminal processing protease